MISKTKFFFKAEILRTDRKVMREGTILAKFPLDALDAITAMAVNEWKRPLCRIELYEIKEGGLMVATSTVKDRVDAVLKSNEQLRPSKYKALREAREKRKNELAAETTGILVTPRTPTSGWNEQGVWVGPSMKPAEKHNSVPPHPDKYTWSADVGTLFQRENFAILKLNEGVQK